MPNLESIVAYAMAYLLAPEALREWACTLRADGTRRLPDPGGIDRI